MLHTLVYAFLWLLCCQLGRANSLQRQEGYELSLIGANDNFGADDVKEFTTYNSANRDVPPSNKDVTKEPFNQINGANDEAFESIRLIGLNKGDGHNGVWTFSKRPFWSQDMNEKHPDKLLSDSDFLKFAEILEKKTYGRLRKRAFDYTSGVSSFGGFKKRASDPISHLTGYDELRKRAVDSVSDNIGLNRLTDQEYGESEKRSFDSIAGMGGFGGFKKKAFDSIAAVSGFGGFKKRTYDWKPATSRFGGYKKKAFDSISGNSAFGGFRRRAFDSISGASGFGGFRKRGKYSPPSVDRFGRDEDKRAFDSIAGASAFGGFGKRSFDSIEHRSFFGGFGKRAFDSIGHMSAFGGFRKRSAPEPTASRGEI